MEAHARARRDDSIESTSDNEPSFSEPSFNTEMARQFRQAADLLEAQRADGHRIRAHRRAADALHYLNEPASDIYRRKGIPGLIAVPTIGRSLAQAIADVVDFGSWRWLDRLKGAVDPERMLCTVAGIGPSLAAKIHDELGIESLEDLEAAAQDGRLATLHGFGPRRIQAVSDSLAGRLRLGLRGVPSEHGNQRPAASSLPSLEEIRAVDSEYRQRVASGNLVLIAPSRFNPEHKAWLPILHTSRGDHHYTAMFSNTARAHQLGRTHDWVVIYRDDPEGGQWTAITARRGPMAGKRVIRGPALRDESTEGNPR